MYSFPLICRLTLTFVVHMNAYSGFINGILTVKVRTNFGHKINRSVNNVYTTINFTVKIGSDLGK